MPIPPGSPPRKPQPTSGLFHFVNDYGTKQPVPPTGRHAVALGPRRPAPAATHQPADTRRYYFVLVGEVLRHGGGNTQFVGECMYVLVKAEELAREGAAWYQASKLMAEGSIKIDLGIQGRVEGLLWGVKAKADVNVVKADLFTVKADLTKRDKFSYDYAGKNGSTKISNGLTLAADVPWLPKTPWGAVSLGGMVEQVN